MAFGRRRRFCVDQIESRVEAEGHQMEMVEITIRVVAAAAAAVASCLLKW